MTEDDELGPSFLQCIANSATESYRLICEYPYLLLPDTKRELVSITIEQVHFLMHNVLEAIQETVEAESN